MIELFSKEKSYVLPNGLEISGEDLSKRDGYQMLAQTVCVVNTDGHVLFGYSPLSSYCENYGVEYNGDNAEEALAQAKENKKIQDEMQFQPTVIPSVMSAMTKVAQISAMSFTDEQALEVKDIYPEYQINHQYKQGEFFTYEGELYKVNQDHTSAEQWEPGSVGTESLYTHLTLNEEGYPIWQQPTGAHDAYNKGDIVEYNGELYKSLIDGNTYAPDAYPDGWEKYTEPET